MQIEAKILAHSISPTGKEILSYEIIYPRIIHAELMTHRMLSKNAASSRAIPVSKVVEMVRINPAMPSRFGANQAGMQDKGEEHTGVVEWFNNELSGRGAWEEFARCAADASEALNTAGFHKQICNRPTEAFQWMKTVITGTEWTNFFWLRDHPAADPTIAELARKMYVAKLGSFPVPLKSGEWHLPYYKNGYWKSSGYVKNIGGVIVEIDDKRGGVTLEEATDISMSCCAQVSYRTLDDTLEKAERVVGHLNLGVNLEEPCHASPSEHQATPIKELTMPNKVTGWQDSVNLPPIVDSWEDGITSYHKELGFMSGNLAGFIQKRQLIQGHTKW